MVPTEHSELSGVCPLDRVGTSARPDSILPPLRHAAPCLDCCLVNVAGYLGTLKEANFRYLFLAHTTSVLGDELAAIALAFAVLEVAGSASALGLVLGARTLPMVIFVLVGGVWADRISRRALMMSSDLGRFITQALTAILLITDTGQLWHLVALQSLNGLATAFFRPAATGLTPATVAPERLQQANALLSFSLSASGIFGAALAGVLVTLVGSGWALGVDAMTFLLSAGLLSRLDIPIKQTKVESPNFLSELREGWREVIGRRWVWISIIGFMMFQLLVLPTFFVLGPVIAHRMPNGAGYWATVMTATGVGALAGDMLALRFEPRRPLRATFLVGALVAPAMILLGLEAHLSLVVIAAIPWGIAFSFSNTLWFTTLQREIPERSLSRVASYDWMGSAVLRPIGYAAVGPVAGAFGAGRTLATAAVAILIIELLLAASPDIGNIERTKRYIGTEHPDDVH
jgi:MFS family permease